MNKTEAKRFVCGVAARILQTNLDTGWVAGSGEESGWSDADERRIDECFSALVDELNRRGPFEGDRRPDAEGADDE